ncbi:MAG: transporter, LysE family [Osedax symbiont Rs2]|nr:MAG: transporter, LysE family [Osedax symbiont Rs2]
MDIDMLLLYTLVAFFYVISPGPAVFLAISNCLTENLKAVAYSSAGNITGLFLLSSVSMLGLGALLMTSASLFLAVKIIGALYLLYLGIKQIRMAGKAKMTASGALNISQKPMLKYFQEGFVLASTNPKPILFFTALFPQFLQLEANVTLQFFSMTGIFMLLSFGSLMSYAIIFKYAKSALTKGQRMAWFHRISGGLFIGMSAVLLQLKNTN